MELALPGSEFSGVIGLYPRNTCCERLNPSLVLADKPFVTSRPRSEEHTSELQSPCNLVCRLLLEKKKHQAEHRLNPHLKRPHRTRYVLNDLLNLQLPPQLHDRLNLTAKAVVHLPNVRVIARLAHE